VILAEREPIFKGAMVGTIQRLRNEIERPPGDL
jgi:hypothetical protein